MPTHCRHNLFKQHDLQKKYVLLRGCAGKRPSATPLRRDLNRVHELREDQVHGTGRSQKTKYVSSVDFPGPATRASRSGSSASCSPTVGHADIGLGGHSPRRRSVPGPCPSPRVGRSPRLDFPRSSSGRGARVGGNARSYTRPLWSPSSGRNRRSPRGRLGGAHLFRYPVPVVTD